MKNSTRYLSITILLKVLVHDQLFLAILMNPKHHSNKS